VHTLIVWYVCMYVCMHVCMQLWKWLSLAEVNNNGLQGVISNQLHSAAYFMHYVIES